MIEFLEILRRADAEDEGGDAASRVLSLPRTNADFEACRLRDVLCGQLKARLGEEVDTAVASSKELRFRGGDCVGAGAIEQVVAQLTTSPSFCSLVDDARTALQQQAARCGATTTTTTAAAAPGDNSTQEESGFLRRSVLSSSDLERDGIHVKKNKAARTDDWVGVFDLCGNGGQAAGGFSPRVDVEAALGQLEAGLGSSGSASSSVDALGLLAEVNAVRKNALGFCLSVCLLPLAVCCSSSSLFERGWIVQMLFVARRFRIELTGTRRPTGTAVGHMVKCGVHA